MANKIPSPATQELLDHLRGKPVGYACDVATSQYAYNTTPPGYRFDCHSSAQAVRGLERRGIIKADYRWRYYRVELVQSASDRRTPMSLLPGERAFSSSVRWVWLRRGGITPFRTGSVDLHDRPRLEQPGRHRPILRF